MRNRVDSLFSQLERRVDVLPKGAAPEDAELRRGEAVVQQLLERAAQALHAERALAKRGHAATAAATAAVARLLEALAHRRPQLAEQLLTRVRRSRRRHRLLHHRGLVHGRWGCAAGCGLR